jgi:hypothetical protein
VTRGGAQGRPRRRGAPRTLDGKLLLAALLVMEASEALCRADAALADVRGALASAVDLVQSARRTAANARKRGGR